MVDLPALLSQDLHLPAPVKWVKDGDYLVCASPFDDASGITLQGLQLRGKTKAATPDRNVSFLIVHETLQLRPKPVARIDWKPFHEHNNKGNGPPELRFKVISGSHHHRFQENWDSVTATVIGKNLPVAVPIDPDPPDFSALLALLKKEFRILNAESIDVPPWEAALT
jgi:hypothetical protein